MMDYEYSVTVPSLYAAPNDDVNIIIHISAVGGGTVGESYGHNSWEYAVKATGLRNSLSGSDLRSARPATHAEMARTLANFLSAAGESLNFNEQASDYADEYPPGRVRDFLVTEYERLAAFADEPAEDEHAESDGTYTEDDQGNWHPVVNPPRYT